MPKCHAGRRTLINSASSSMTSGCKNTPKQSQNLTLTDTPQPEHRSEASPSTAHPARSRTVAAPSRQRCQATAGWGASLAAGCRSHRCGPSNAAAAGGTDYSCAESDVVICVIQLTRKPVQVQIAQVLLAGTWRRKAAFSPPKEKRRTRTPLAQCTASMASISAGVNISIIMMLYLARTNKCSASGSLYIPQHESP